MAKKKIFHTGRRGGFNIGMSAGIATALGVAVDQSAPAKNKFDAKKTVCQHEHTHDSRAEARRCNALHLLQRGKLIRDLQVQPQYWFVIDGRQVKHENGRRLGYRADFAYHDVEQDRAVVEDVKGGYRDDAWTIRKAVFRALFPAIELREVK